MASWTSSSYEGRYLQLTITETVNTPGNSSTLSWTLTSAGGIETYYTVDATTVTIICLCPICKRNQRKPYGYLNTENRRYYRSG